MSVLATLGIVVGLVVIALMAVAPALVDLNERFPVRERDEARQPLDLRLARHGHATLGRH